MNCWHCGTELESMQRVAFKAICDHCSSYLHCCKNCQYYKPGMPNDCIIPGTDPVADKEKANYCEEFSRLTVSQIKASDPSSAAKKLFKEDDQPEKRDFGSLFK